MEPQKRRRQINQAREMLLGFPQWLPPSRAFLYPVVDALLLVGGRQTEIAIFEKSLGVPLFSTSSSLLSVKENKDHFLIELPDAPNNGPHHPDRAVKVAPNSRGVGGIASEDYDTEEAIKEVLRGVNGKTGEEFRRCLHASLNKVESPPLISERQIAARDEHIIEEEGSEWLRRATEVINEATSQLTRCRVHQIGRGRQRRISIFSILYKRCPHGEEDVEYTPVTIPVKSSLSRHDTRGEHTGEDSLNSFKTSKVLRVRPSDNIRIIQRGDKIKRLVEELNITNSRFNQDHLEEHSCAFVVPIHVSGFPWLSIVKLVSREVDVQSSIISFYENAIPRISSVVRPLLKEHYVEYILNIFRDELRSEGLSEAVRNTNLRYSRLSEYCPFVEYKLEHTEERSWPGELIKKYEGKEIYLYKETKTGFRSNIKYGEVDDSKVIKGFKRVIREVRSEEERERAKAYKFFRDRAEEQAHSIFNRNPMSKVYEAKKTVVDSSGLEHEGGSELERLLSDAYDLQVFRDVSLKIMLSDIGSDPKLLTKEINSRTAYDMIEWLQARVPSSEPVPDIRREDAKLEIPEGHMSDAFTSLWNLWENSRNAYQTFRDETDTNKNSKFEITIKNRNGSPAIIFVNSGHIPDDQKNKLRNKKMSNDFGGINVIKRSLRRLGWEINSIKVIDQETRIVIKEKNA